MPSFSQTPDEPRPFGYKLLWFAVKATDPAAVLDALELGTATPANWATGLAAANSGADGDDRWVFVSPPVGGWVLVVGAFLPYPTQEAHRDIGRRFDLLFSRLMSRFDDVQFFGSHHVVGFVTWARALKGKPVRAFTFADEVMANVGAQTAEEAKLGFADLTGLSPSDALNRLYGITDDENEDQEDEDAIPDEEDVTGLAALWSLDPTGLPKQGHPPGVGLAARLPDDLAQ